MQPGDGTGICRHGRPDRNRLVLSIWERGRRFLRSTPITERFVHQEDSGSMRQYRVTGALPDASMRDGQSFDTMQTCEMFHAGDGKLRPVKNICLVGKAEHLGIMQDSAR